MEILKPSNGEQLNHPTLFAADILASHSVLPAKDKARTTRVTYGPGSETLLAFLDPVTQSWKMYEATCLLGELPSLEILPVSGITRNGKLLARPRKVPRILENASLSAPTPSGMYPTPNAADCQRGAKKIPFTKGKRTTLNDVCGGRPNPTFVEWLMGFPMGWTELED
jgi:hypothetical protein